MTTVRQTLTRAIRLTGAGALGETPPADEMDAALTVLQSMVLTLLTATRLTDVLVTANYTAGENERVFNDSGGAITVTMPTTVEDAVTGEDRPPTNGAMVEVAGTTPERHIYVSELAAWKELTNLALTDEQPFGPSLDEGIAAMVAVRLAPDLQQMNLSEWVLELAAQGRRMVRQRFRQPYAVTLDQALLTSAERSVETS